jgi:hypothetical protein
MKESGYYPPGAEFNSSAPFNEKSKSLVNLEVTISVTLSKTVTIQVEDYSEEVEKDEEGFTYVNIDTSECNLKEAVLNQVNLPQEVFKDWIVDDFEVIEG